MLSIALPVISNTLKETVKLRSKEERYLYAKEMLAALILILRSKNIQTFKIQVEVESVSLTLTLLVFCSLSGTLIIAAVPFAILVAICNGHNVQSKAVFVSEC